jgi:hypothetical protein
MEPAPFNFGSWEIFSRNGDSRTLEERAGREIVLGKQICVQQCRGDHEAPNAKATGAADRACRRDSSVQRKMGARHSLTSLNRYRTCASLLSSEDPAIPCIVPRRT